MKYGLWLGFMCVWTAGLNAAANTIMPSGGQATLLIEGSGQVMDGEHNIPSIFFNQSGSWGGSPIGGTALNAHQQIVTPEVPDITMSASALSGADFYHSASNQMTVILRAAPAASLAGAAFGQPYFYADFKTHAKTKVQGSFQIDLLPGQQAEDYVDLLVDIEYVGLLSREYYARAATSAVVTIYPTPCQGWTWSHQAATTDYTPGANPLQEMVVNEQVVLNHSSFAGGSVTFSAELDCTAMMDASANQSNFIGIDTFAAGSVFDPGLIITMTVLPEPATMSLLLVGGALLARRRR